MGGNDSELCGELYVSELCGELYEDGEWRDVKWSKRRVQASNHKPAREALVTSETNL